MKSTSSTCRQRLWAAPLPLMPASNLLRAVRHVLGQAHDGVAQIGTGSHVRAVVELSQFEKNLEKPDGMGAKSW